MVTHPDDLFNTKDSYLRLLPEELKNYVARCITHEQYLDQKIIAHLGIQIPCNRYEIIEQLPQEFIRRSKLLNPKFSLNNINGKQYLNFIFTEHDKFKNILLPEHNDHQLASIERSPDNQSIIIFTSYKDKADEVRYSTYIFDAQSKKLITLKNTVEAITSNDNSHVITAAHRSPSNSLLRVRNSKTGLKLASLQLPQKYPPFDTVALFFDKSGQNIGLKATTVTDTKLFFRWNLAELLDKEQKLKLLTARDQALLLSYLVKIKNNAITVTDIEIEDFIKPLDNKLKQGGSFLAKAIKDMAANRGQLLDEKENNQLSNLIASAAETSL